MAFGCAVEQTFLKNRENKELKLGKAVYHHYLIQIHAHNCQNLNSSPKRYLQYNITSRQKRKYFRFPTICFLRNVQNYYGILRVRSSED
jgi:hypothetical protein